MERGSIKLSAVKLGKTKIDPETQQHTIILRRSSSKSNLCTFRRGKKKQHLYNFHEMQ